MKISLAVRFCSAFLVLTIDENGSRLSTIQGVNGDIFRNQDTNSWYKDGVKLIQDNLGVKPNTNTAKSAILFLGDGMGFSTITAGRILDGR
ncbi:hypothetical protein OS493_039271 [Desmophyllum pertusum]|uniref:Alkaline phosphatase n=1 Tax=Desmophyllum pertusum TaxID=174260 RepID=A0A9X0D7Z0_9CNID|nr:hypothetical protein OS493_039271 [Desmophyllum pertusum]